MPIGGSNYEIEATISLKDETQQGMRKASESFKSFGQRVEELGHKLLKMDREQNRAMNSMLQLSAAISGPLLLAAKNSAKYNDALRSSFESMSRSTQDAADILGRAMQPTIEGMAASLKMFVDWLQSLDQEMLKNVVTWAMWIAGVLAAIATANKFYDMLKRIAGIVLLAGKAFVGWLAAIGPVGWALLAVVAILASFVIWWDKLKGVAIPVLNAIEVLIRVIGEGLGIIVLALGKVLDTVVEKIQSVIKWGKLLPDKFGGKMFKDMDAGLEDFQKSLESFNSGVWQQLQDNAEKAKKALEGIFTGEKGSLAQSVENAHVAVKGLLTTLGGRFKKAASESSAAWNSFFNGMYQGFKESMAKFSNWGEMGKQIVSQTFSAAANTLSQFFQDAFSGELKTAQEYLESFGKAMLKMFADVIAQIMVYWAVLTAMKMMGIPIPPWLGGTSKHSGGQILHSGGLVYAHQGAYAPDERLAVLQTGEGVLSRQGMRNVGGEGALQRMNDGSGPGAGGGGGSPVVVIQAWDTKDIVRNRKTIEGIIGDALKSNSSLRNTVKKYT